MRDRFDLWHYAGLFTAGDGDDLPLATTGLATLRSPVVGDGVGVGLGEGAVDAGTQTDADHKTANSGDQQDNALHDAGAVGVLQMSMLDPAEQVLLCRDADATADNEAERGQHETVAPGLE